MTRIEAAFGRFAGRAHARPARALLVAAVLLGVGLFFAARLSLETDLTGLLPKSFDSVKGLDELRQKFGGVGYVVVAGYDSDEANLKRFADDVAPKMERLSNIRFVEYKRASKFFKERALYYMSLDDLGEVERRIRAREKFERRQKNPMYIKFEDEQPPSLDFSDIEKKYGGQSSKRLSGDGSSEYYLSPKEKMVVILAKPKAASTDLGYSATVLGEVEAMLAQIDLKQYGPDFKVQLTGTYKKKLDQQAQIARDLSWSSTVALVLLLGYLLWHFRSIIAVGLNLAPVLVSLVWTYGVVGAIYGSVNLLTGFLAAILGGLGIEHGIHLLGRYESLRSGGASSEEATREAFTHTGGAAFISALVAAFTFLSLAISEFRAFREFGVIAALGMLIVIGAYLLVLPALLGIACRFGWKPSIAATRMIKVGWMVRLGNLLARQSFRRTVTCVMGVGLLALALDAGRVRFNYDFSALEDSTLASFRFDKITNRVLGYSQTPVVMLTPDANSERGIVRELSQRKAKLGAESTIDFVGALDDLVPQQQEEKQPILQSIGEVLAKVKRDKLDGATQTKFDDLLAATKSAPFSRKDLPESVRRQFLGIDQGDSGFVMLFPAIETADGVAVRKFAREVRAVELPGYQRIGAAGEPMILADIIEMVTREMPRILAAALVSVLLIMWLTLGSLKLAVLCLSPTLISIFALTGLMPLIGLEFNYLNIIVVPVLIGTTVDAGVHLVTRLEAAGADFVSVYAETGRAITGGILTSAVGFGAMLLADHPGLNSIGTLANLGFATNLLVMLLGFPALLLPLLRRRQTV